jgi:hypothetical protein
MDRVVAESGLDPNDIAKGKQPVHNGADGEQKWEAHPAIVGIVYDGLNDIGTDD